jgi:hypothetical protein
LEGEDEFESELDAMGDTKRRAKQTVADSAPVIPYCSWTGTSACRSPVTSVRLRALPSSVK